MKSYFFAGILLLLVSKAFAQSDFASFQVPDNTFASPNNEHYWKNKKPYEGYWQQDTYYKIKANIDETTDIIDGEELVTYTNNSPTALSRIYFHLYQNAFQPDSYADKLGAANKVKNTFGKYEAKKKGTEIEWMTVVSKNPLYDGLELRPNIDNTVMWVDLYEPLASGEKITFKIKFKTYFDTGSMRRRFKKFKSSGNTHYDGVHWYPRVSVFDRKNAWDTNQHLGKEFYGDFGTYDVQLTFASNYVCEATGYTLNEDEVLPPDLKTKLNIRNFASKPWGEKASIITPYKKNERKSWQYHAENVHDFAFTADPTYRIGESVWNGVRCISLVQEPHAAGWQNAASYAAAVVRVYSTDIGMYAYPKIIVADAEDGMEYPMITLDGGHDPDYRGLLAHEIGHNWFYGMIGNNETYRAMLDEGFTQFLTAWSMERIDGDVVTSKAKEGYVNNYRKPQQPRIASCYRGYMLDAVKNEDPAIDIHSDYYGSALGHGGGYRHVYMKTATMLYNLQYVLGDDLFLKAMQHYFKQWSFCHPYDDDFRESITQYVGTDLSWFFDQWITTSKTIDYGIKSIKKQGYGDYKITLVRKGEMQMPLDITIKSKSGKEYYYYIPNTHFNKTTKSKILPKWEGWDKLNTEYSFTVPIADGIEDVIIDESKRLADIHPFDNQKKCTIKPELDSKIYNPPSVDKYDLKLRPDLWYNDLDGAKLGIHINGNYLNHKRQLHASAWYNSRVVAGSNQKEFADKIYNKLIDKFNFAIAYKTPFTFIGKGVMIAAEARLLDGLQLAKVELSKATNYGKLAINIKSMYRKNATSLQYLHYNNLWNTGKYNNQLNMSYTHPYNYAKGNGTIVAAVQLPFIKSDYNRQALTLEVINTNNLGKYKLKTRTFGYYQTGDNPAPESQLLAWGGNNESMMDDKYYRSRAFFDATQLPIGSQSTHFQYGGGLNMRGYAGYTLTEQDKDGTLHPIWRSNTAVAENIELEFDQLVRFRPRALRALRLNTYLFADAALLTYTTSSLKIAKPRIDAGLGLALTVRRWYLLEGIKPLTFRLDFPIFVNSPPYNEPDYISTKRFVFSIGRAF
jgi:aminopeptidase N